MQRKSKLEALLRCFLTAAAILMFVEVVAEVASRFIFHYPLPWGAEVSQTLLVWLTFVGSAVVFNRRGHIGIDMFAERLPKRAQAVLNRACLAVIAAFLAVGIWSGVAVTMRTWKTTTAALQIPAGVMYLALPVGFALTALYALRMLFSTERAER
ncbi:MAG: TRAP transporter small permease [Synergistaceae bacterium]|nr:TRAP transporter small permease [Synergistaceae bacterium]